MKNSTILTMIGAATVGIILLFVINVSQTLSPSAGTIELLDPYDVRGSAVIHKGLPYTLSFDEQSLVVSTAGHPVKVAKKDYPPPYGPFDFEKLIIYRFGKPDLELIPLKYEEENLVFSIPSLNLDGYYMELSGGELRSMIGKAFDP